MSRPKVFGEPCWTPEGVAKGISLVAQVSDESRHYFLASHSPISGIEDKKRKGTQFNEEQVFSEIFGNAQDQIVAAIIGIPGAGKSHLIRWLKLRWEVEQQEALRQQEAFTELIPVMVKRRSGSLKDALEQILEQLPGKFSRHLKPLQTAVEKISHVRAKAKLADEFAMRIQFDLEEQGTSLPNRLRKFEEIFRSGGFREWLCRDDGALDRHVKRLVGQSDVDEREQLPQFDEKDFLPSDSARGDNTPEVTYLIDEFEDDSSLRGKAATVCNELATNAIQRMTGIAGEDLMSMLRAIRRELHEDGQGLALFIEDVSVMGALDLDIVQAVTEDGEPGWKLRAVLGMTDTGWGKLAENQEQRVNGGCYTIDAAIGEWREDREALAAFAGRYLNAVRAEESELQRWAEDGLAENAPAPNACKECPVRDECHGAFGVVEINPDQGPIGMFPLSDQAPHNLLEALDVGNAGIRANPRGFLENILRKLLENPQDIADGKFPPLRPRGSMPVRVDEPAGWAEFQRKFLGGFSIEDMDRVRDLAGAWFPDPDAEQVAARLKLVLDPLNLPKFSADAGPVKVQPPVGPQPGATLQPPAPATDPKLTKLLNAYREWVQGETLHEDGKPRDLVLKFLKGSLPLENSRHVPLEVFKKCLAATTNILIEGQRSKPQQGRFTLLLDRSEETRDLLEALTQHDHFNPRGKGEGWNFDGGEAHRRVVHLWLRKHTDRVLDAMKPEGLDPQVSIRAAAQLLYIHGSAKQGQAPSNPLEVMETLFAPQDKRESPSNPGHWRELLTQIGEDKEEISEFLRDKLAARQGTGAPTFVNPLPVLEAVTKFLKRPVVEQVSEDFHKGYWQTWYTSLARTGKYPSVGEALSDQFRHGNDTFKKCEDIVTNLRYTVGKTKGPAQLVQDSIALKAELTMAKSPVPHDAFNQAEGYLKESSLFDEGLRPLKTKLNGSKLSELVEINFPKLEKAHQAIALVNGYVETVEKEVAAQEKALSGRGNQTPLLKNLCETLKKLATLKIGESPADKDPKPPSALKPEPLPGVDPKPPAENDRESSDEKPDFTVIGELRLRVERLPELRKTGEAANQIAVTAKAMEDAYTKLIPCQKSAIALKRITASVGEASLDSEVSTCHNNLASVADLASKLKKHIEDKGLLPRNTESRVSNIKTGVGTATKSTQQLWIQIKKVCVDDHLTPIKMAERLRIAGAAEALTRVEGIEKIPSTEGGSAKVIECDQEARKVLGLLPKDGPVGTFIGKLLGETGADLADLDDSKVKDFVDKNGLRERLKVELKGG